MYLLWCMKRDRLMINDQHKAAASPVDHIVKWKRIASDYLFQCFSHEYIIYFYTYIYDCIQLG